MAFTLAVHVLAGTIGLVAGFVALYTTKGATVHRKSGLIFVYAMLAMCLAGFAIAVVRNVAPEINVPAATLTAYLIITSLATARSSWLRSGAWGAGLMLVALAVGGTMLAMGVEAVANGGTRNGMPAFPFFMFATIGLLGAYGDYRTIRHGALEGRRRLARHLWRMSIALFLAALSFSVQFVKILGREGIRLPGFSLALPMLLVLGTMAYWLWRVRRKGVNVERWRLDSSSPPSPSPVSSPVAGRA